MIALNIRLDTIEKVKEFVQIITKFDGEFEILSGKYVIDAKSILGIFSIDLSKPVILRIEKDDNINCIQRELSKFIV